MKIKYNNSDHSFQEDLRSAVKNYFDSRKVSYTGDWRLYCKSAILIPSAIITYLCIVNAWTTGWASLGLCALLGVLFAFIGFNIMHDASHKSYSKKAWVNNLMVLSLEFMGNSSFLWHTKHVVEHHTYTNTERDTDIQVDPFLRLRSEQKLRRLHRYQNWYATPLYAIEYLYWVWFTDFRSYFRRKIGEQPIKKIRTKDHVTFWSGKLFHGIFMVAIPMYYFSTKDFLIGYLTFAGICGLFISFVFQLAHVVEGREFPNSDKNGVINTSWAVMQVRTTSNFSTQSVILNWLLGGLNFQIEHHVLPGISHVHYRELSPIVEAVCLKHGEKYCKPSLVKALQLHFRKLKKMGVSE